MVNYLNSKPFEFGLTSKETINLFELHAAHPADCATIFKRKDADIGLIPVGALKDIQNYRIFSDYCIGCDGEVRTVCIMSQKPISQCKRLIADTHSRTSVLLAQILLKEYWKLDIPIIPQDIKNSNIHFDDALLLIGDKVFDHENDYRYIYDLGRVWKDWTELPFVFAVWVAHDNIPIEKDTSINNALRSGIEHLDYIINKESSESLDLYYYFKHNIQYNFDDKKKEAFTLFIDYCNKLEEVK